MKYTPFYTDRLGEWIYNSHLTDNQEFAKMVLILSIS